MLAALLFSLAAHCPPLFHSRIVTVMPVSHPPTRLIHISPSCWTIYRSFEITIEMGTVHWVELLIQCAIQIYCFKKKIQSRFELCFKKYLAAQTVAYAENFRGGKSFVTFVTVINDCNMANDYNMTRDIDELYSDEKIDDSNSESDIVIKETLYLMCECANIIN